MSTENSSGARSLEYALWLRNQVASPNLTPRQFAGAVWTDDAKEAAARAMLAALERIAQPHDCGCKPCVGQCVSQQSLAITLDAIRDEASIAIAAAKAAGIKS